MEAFVHGTRSIDNDGNFTDPIFLDAEKTIKVTVIIPKGSLGDFTSYDHQKMWKAYNALQTRIEAIVKEKFPEPPAESCTITLEKADLAPAH